MPESHRDRGSRGAWSACARSLCLIPMALALLACSARGPIAAIHSLPPRPALTAPEVRGCWIESDGREWCAIERLPLLRGWSDLQDEIIWLRTRPPIDQKKPPPTKIVITALKPRKNRTRSPVFLLAIT